MKKLFGRVIVALFFIYGFFANTALAVVDAPLEVTQIKAVQTTALADGTFENGWKWTFDVTLPTSEDTLRMKFDNWVNGSNIIPVAGNMRFYTDQSQNANDSAHAIGFAGPLVYSEIMNLARQTDLSPEKAGRQIKINVEVKIPVGTATGSYSSSYGISSSADTIPPVIILAGSNPETIERGTAYIELGATATDNIDGILPVSIATSSVLMNITGSYSVIYSAIDLDGNSTSTTRAVNVVDTTPPTATIVYSTTNSTTDPVVATITPSEALTATSSLTHTFTSNGSYTFEFTDLAGNFGSAVASVSNIVPVSIPPTQPSVVGTATVTVPNDLDVLNPCILQNLQSIIVSPNAITIEGGNRQTFYVKGTDNDGMCSLDNVVWISDNKSVATIGSESGTAVAKKPGKTTIKATAGGKIGTATLNVIEPVIPEAPNPPLSDSEIQTILSERETSSIIVSPAQLTVDINQELASPAQFSAVFRDGVVGATGVHWVSSDPVVAEIDPETGVLLNMHAGMVKITATATIAGGGIITGSSILTVVDSAYVAPAPIIPSDAHTLTSVAVTPSVIALNPRDWYKFNATPLDERGQPYNVYIVWSSSDPAVIEVDPVSGNAKAKGIGTAIITATSSYTPPVPAVEPILP